MKIKYIGALPKGKVHLGNEDISFNRNEIFEVSPETYNKLPKGQFIVIEKTGNIHPIINSDKQKLINLKAVEDELAEALLLEFGSFEGVKKATISELESISGIGVKRAKVIKEQLEVE